MAAREFFRAALMVSVLSGALLNGCAQAPLRPGSVQRGLASWYGPGFHGRRTASGETFDRNALTAAHRTLPMQSRVRVVDPLTGASVVVRINDRGPFTKGRVIDLSQAAARELGIISKGTADVEVHVISVPER